MDETEDSPTSLWMIRAAELFPKERTEKEDANLQIPFNERKQKFFLVLNNLLNLFFFILQYLASQSNTLENVKMESLQYQIIAYIYQILQNRLKRQFHCVSLSPFR